MFMGKVRWQVCDFGRRVRKPDPLASFSISANRRLRTRAWQWRVDLLHEARMTKGWSMSLPSRRPAALCHQKEFARLRIASLPPPLSLIPILIVHHRNLSACMIGVTRSNLTSVCDTEWHITRMARPLIWPRSHGVCAADWNLRTMVNSARAVAPQWLESAAEELFRLEKWFSKLNDRFRFFGSSTQRQLPFFSTDRIASMTVKISRNHWPCLTRTRGQLDADPHFFPLRLCGGG